MGLEQLRNIKEEYASKDGDLVEGIEGKIHQNTEKLKTDICSKTYKEVKPHISQDSEDKAVKGERDNDDNYEHVYYFLV